MLSLKAKEDTLPTQSRAERGSMTAEGQESSTSGILSLLIEMREEIKRRDEQFREEIRWRDEAMTIENKKREGNLTTKFQQRNEK